MEILVFILIIPAIMSMAALVTIYQHGLIAVALWSVLGALYVGVIFQLFRGFGHPHGATPSFDWLDMLRDSFLALVLIAITLMFYYAAVIFFESGSYLFALFFLVLTLMLPYVFVLTDGFSPSSFKDLVVSLDRKNPFKQTYEKNDKALKAAFNDGMNDEKSIRSFVKISTKIAKSSPYAKRFSFQFANYSTKILISRTKNRDYGVAKKIVNNYIDNIIPFSGFHIKAYDLASNALVLSMLSNDQKPGQKVIDELLGSHVEANTIKNEILLFNLACYYALKRQKNKMLDFIARSLSCGKKADQFLSDSDFEYYWEDKEFVTLLHSGK
ncbi:MAG: hypothetical protein L3J89_09880 [Gammaproteobacteria bacterium]|nr:hypothetical protein [Gammaproteobacteria bacterium]